MQATVFGSVSDWPDLKERRTEIPIAVDSLVVDRSLYVVEGGLLLTVTDTTTLLQRGDRIIFRARLYPLPTTSRSGFNYSRYLSLKGLFGRAYLPTLLDIQIDRRSTIGILAVVDRIRDEIIGIFETCLTPQAAALAKGLMLGETRGIEPRVYAMFRDSGTLHLLAVSGSNVALVLLVFLVVVRPLRMPLKVRRFSMLAVIVVYALLCHLEPSVVRASVMAALVVFARLLHRKIDLNQIIALTAALILLYDPGQMFDVGFQLSFITAWGLIFIVPKITALLDVYHQRRWYRWLVFPLTISLTAQLVSTPLSVLYFQRLPLISVPANLIVVPLVTFCVIGLAAVLGAAAIHPLLGLMLGSWVDPLHRLTVWVLEQMGGDRMPIIETTPTLLPANLDWAVVLAVYGLMVLLILALRSQRLRRLAVFSIAGLFLAISALAAIRPVSTATNAVFIHPAAGGTVAIRPLGESEGDVIVSSIIGRDYPLDSTVLWPLLKRHGIDSIHYLFIQGIAFDALDDVWRFAVERMADSVFVNPAQRAGLIDARRRFESGGTSPAMVVLSHHMGASLRPMPIGPGRTGCCCDLTAVGCFFPGPSRLSTGLKRTGFAGLPWLLAAAGSRPRKIGRRSPDPGFPQ